MCERIHAGQGFPCPEGFPDDPALWCDYCRRNYDIYMDQCAEQARWDALTGGDPPPAEPDPAPAPEEAPCPLDWDQLTAYWDWVAKLPTWAFANHARLHWPELLGPPRN